MHTNELMIYRNLDYGKILRDMTFLIEHEGSGYYNQEDLRTLFLNVSTGFWNFRNSMAWRGISGTHT